MIDSHTDELVDWLIKEAGATRMRALVELGIVRAATMAAVTHTALGVKTVPSDVPGKENRVYTRPAGVVGVISPWAFPLYLSYRSVAPALAVGNAVVLKPAEDTPVTGGLLIAKVLEEAGLPPGVLSAWSSGREPRSETRWSPTPCRASSRSPVRPAWGKGSRRRRG